MIDTGLKSMVVLALVSLVATGACQQRQEIDDDAGPDTLVVEESERIASPIARPETAIGTTGEAGAVSEGRGNARAEVRTEETARPDTAAGEATSGDTMSAGRAADTASPAPAVGETTGAATSGDTLLRLREYRPTNDSL